MTNSITFTEPTADDGRWARILRHLTPGLCSAAIFLVGAPVHSYVWRALLRSRSGIEPGGWAR